MKKNRLVLALLLALMLLGLAQMVFSQDSTATGGAEPAPGSFLFIVGGAGLAIKGVIELLTRTPILPNKVVAGIGVMLTALVVWAISAGFKMDYETVFGAVSGGGWLGSLGNTAFKPNP